MYCFSQWIPRLGCYKRTPTTQNFTHHFSVCPKVWVANLYVNTTLILVFGITECCTVKTTSSCQLYNQDWPCLLMSSQQKAFAKILNSISPKLIVGNPCFWTGVFWDAAFDLILVDLNYSEVTTFAVIWNCFLFSCKYVLTVFCAKVIFSGRYLTKVVVLKLDPENPLGACSSDLLLALSHQNEPGQGLRVCHFLMLLTHVLEKHWCKGYIGKSVASDQFRKTPTF